MIPLTSSQLTTEPRIITRQNPATGDVVSREIAHDLAESLRFVSHAAAAFPAWSALAVDARADHLRALADRLIADGDALCHAMCEEIGAPQKWAAHNVTFAARLLYGVADQAGALRHPETLTAENDIISEAHRVPCGVCLGIAPWNAPVILGIRAIAAPLLCGNTVLLKGNEIAPRTFRLIGDAVVGAGFPQDVVQVFLCPQDDSERIVDALIEHPVVRRVNFTGSTRIGRRIAALCAKHLKRPLLELGGQAPMVVLDDADLDLAASEAVQGAYLNQGQICMSTERLIVQTDVADALIQKIEKLRDALVVGDPIDAATDIGPVIGVGAAERLSGLLGDAVSKGARLVGGGGMRGAYFHPTLLDGVEADMRLYTEETFGPILSVTRVATDQEAVTVANDSDYGLAASVFSGNPMRADQIASQIHTGICHINRCTVDDDPLAPFGGVKASGYGRFGGRWALDEFTELRWITKRKTP
ncbi:aldehyde dehydrogenase family protein [Phaeobacter sp. J2-8]|uniref:aldehyde dehydrogenase family protein n=1 Tax=Phaeobacter sp. J2-8 TaxID=2931394 RepID=UPI001FD01385|nr:aldehyde dehydrogenase family protein [Phaeobacter sp. J2-8]MCJ7872944.1 aldehyde dehydrogenase family protein [Phaeobacter sp. J2-8]